MSSRKIYMSDIWRRGTILKSLISVTWIGSFVSIQDQCLEYKQKGPHKNQDMSLPLIPPIMFDKNIKIICV